MLSDERVQSESGSPEDLRVHCLEAAYALMQSASASVVREALNDSLFLKALGHAVSVLLTIATHDSSKSLKITAMKTLHLWLQRSESVATCQESESRKLAHVYGAFVPGVSIAIMKLLTKDDNLPQALISTSVSVLSLTICLSMPRGLEQESGMDARISESGKNLQTVIRKIGPDLTSSTRPVVRHSLVTMCTSIVRNCSHLLVHCLHEVLFEILLTLSMDEEDGVKNEAGDFVTSVLQSDTKYGLRVYESLEGKVLECMECLTEQMEDSRLSDQKILPGLQLLAGMFRIMHPRGCNCFMNIPTHRHHFIRFLTRVCSLSQEQHRTRFNPLHESGELESLPGDEKTLQMVSRMLRFIASKVDPNVIEDILNDLHEHSIPHPEAIFAANQIVDGLKGEIPFSHVENCQLVMQHHCDSGQPLTGADLTRVSLATEGLIVFLQHETAFGQRAADDFLPMIYLLLNIRSYQVSQTSARCEKVLCLLSQRLHYRSVNDMVQDKLSYLTSRLQKDHQLMPGYTNTGKLLQSLLSFCSRQSIRSFEPLLESSLLSLDSSYYKNPTPVLQTLLVLLNFISRKQAVCHPGSSDADEREPLLSLSDWDKKWTQFVSDIKAADISDADITAEQTDDEERRQEDEDRTEGRTKELPADAQMCKMILEKCSNLLASPEPTDRILVLDIISEVALILKDYEDIFLPFVHKVWKQLVLRLSDEVPVARSAFHVLLLLSDVCGDFIERRTTTDVLPKIVSFLSRHSTLGIRRETRVGHRFTITFKYQCECLQKIGPLAVGLNVRGTDLWKLIVVVLKYISRDQPKELCEAAGQAIRSFWSLDPDSVWFYCRRSLHPREWPLIPLRL